MRKGRSEFKKSFFVPSSYAGLFTRSGYFFNLDTLEWEAKTGPTWNPLAGPNLPNSVYTFQVRGFLLDFS